MPDLVRPVRHAARRLLRTPGASAAAVLTLALGVAALTLAYRAAYPVLVRPLDLPQPERLVDVRETFRGDLRQIAPANYLDWRARARAFSDLAAYDGSTATLLLDEGGMRVPSATVSGNFFRTLGVDAAVGRVFDPAFRRGGERVAVVSHALWRDALGADPAAIGRVLRVDELTVRVIGVLPPDFAFAPEPADLWLRSPDEAPELRGADIDLATLRDAWYFRAVGRLAEGVSLAAAGAEMDALAAGLRSEHPETNADAGARVRPLRELVVADGGAALRLLVGAALLVLLVAAANVTHLLLARSAATAGERSVRRALGARPGRLAADAFVEGGLLAVVGGALGALGASALPQALLRLAPGAGAGAATAGPPAGGVPFALGIVIAAAALVSALPAALAARTGTSGAASLRGGAGRAGGARLRWGLVAVEAGLALALVGGTGLLLRSLDRVARVDAGIDAPGLWTARVAIPGARSRSFEERVADLEALGASLAARPGVEAAAVGHDPLGIGARASLRVEGRPAAPADQPDVAWQPVSATYLETIGIPLLRGRGLQPTDRADAPDVAVVNEALARLVFPGEDPLGRRVTIGLDGHDRPLTIVGVAADTRNRGPAEAAFPVMYRPLAQTRLYGATDVFVAVRASDRGAPGASSVREAVHEVLPAAAVYAERSGSELAARATADARRMLAVLGAFAITTLLLGAVGVYGVASFVVRERRRELAVRLALGAKPSSVVSMVLRQGLAAAGLGLVLGLPVTWAVGRGLAHLLVGVGPADPLALAGAGALLLAGTLAALVPAAREAVRTDPARTLRE